MLPSFQLLHQIPSNLNAYWPSKNSKTSAQEIFPHQFGQQRTKPIPKNPPPSHYRKQNSKTKL
jgi:hypothetical protein